MVKTQEEPILEAQRPTEAVNFRSLMSSLKYVKIPEWLKEVGLRCQEYFIMKFGGHAATVDRSRVDAQTAAMLYQAKAMPDEVYSFMRDHMLQNSTPVQRPYGPARGGKMHTTRRLTAPGDSDRQARRIAANMAPQEIVMDGWRARNQSKEKDLGQLYNFLLPHREEGFIARERELLANQERMPEVSQPQVTTVESLAQAPRV